MLNQRGQGYMVSRKDDVIKQCQIASRISAQQIVAELSLAILHLFKIFPQRGRGERGGITQVISQFWKIGV